MAYINFTRAARDEDAGAVIVRESEDGPVIEVIDCYESDAAAKLEEARQKYAGEQSRPLANPVHEVVEVDSGDQLF